MKVNIVFGTVYGSAQAVAEQLTAQIQQAGVEVELREHSQLSGWLPPAEQVLLVVSSTTGQGDVPDDIAPWFQALKQQAPYLPAVYYAVVALGDSSYEHFCGAGRQFDELLAELGAKSLLTRLQLDATETMSPEQDASAWLPKFLAAISSR
ncbi:flavodoxin [Shewanella sp. NIFS-20-20]|uniref:flavodoxin n=1 Tax=Shewanella sp. NIFS-20-20 TaxID=2853806 RepID=UPI001C445695|nr:flavodoxin [Shewanella sp. NIFS-20-20]MBV7317321.1 flavodoxin [Shewanella sp. NIFS-20-20]